MATRRVLGLLLVALVPAGCTMASAEAPSPLPAPSGTSAAATSTSTTTTSVTTTTTSAGTTATASGPAAGSAVARGGEVLPAAKQLAGRIATGAVTYDEDASPEAIAAAAVAEPARRPALADAVRPLYQPRRWSRGTVVYTQLGGFRAERASVMVVVRREVGTGDEVELTETRTLDVRLARTGGAWRFEELASVGGEPAPRPARLPAEAAAVVDNPRIELPDSARWDIYRGRATPALLRVMARLAEQTPYGVVTLSSGHPHNVFGTGRVSNHTRGRAVDVYRIGGTNVVDGRAVGSPVWDLARSVAQWSVLSEFGSPWRFGARSFTDTVHEDHFHIAAR